MIGPLAYIGGKRRLAKRILALLPEHTTYVEPFAGGAQVFFHKPRSRIEVLNDLDGDIVNFLRICREHPQELVRALEYLVPSRALFAQFAAQPIHLLTDVQRAARFLYLQKNAFGGRVHHRSFRYGVAKRPNYNPERLPSVIGAAAQRLRHVQLENGSYERVLERYDRETTLFYLDPPYVGLGLYNFNLDDAQFVELARRLRQIKGKFLLSINDCPQARAWFAEHALVEVSVPYSGTRDGGRFRELLVANYSLPPALTSHH